MNEENSVDELPPDEKGHLLHAGGDYWTELGTADPPTQVIGRGDVPHVLQPEGLNEPATFLIRGYVEPRWPFGLPENDDLVLPSGAEIALSEPRDDGGVTYGTLSTYRNLSDRIEVRDLDLGDTVRLALFDNNVAVLVDARDAPEAYELGIAAIDRFLGNLTVSQVVRFSFHFSGMWVAATGQKVPSRTTTGVLVVRGYDLDGLRGSIRDAGPQAQLKDDRLQRALDYFSHALLLRELAHQLDSFEKNYYFIHSSIFLNFWKAATVIAGDSTERDFQSRYKKLGLDYEFFSTRLTKIKELRDSRDVGHHDLSREASEEIRQEAQTALEVAKSVIEAYRRFLLAGGNL